MIQRFFYTGIILFGGLFMTSSPGFADSSTLRVTAAVEPARYIYLDKQGDIYKLVSNTNQSAPPGLIGTNLSLTQKISSEYAQIVAQNGDNLVAGHIYYSQKYNPYRQLASWLNSNSLFVGRFY
jgi:hypothetical protein